MASDVRHNTIASRIGNVCYFSGIFFSLCWLAFFVQSAINTYKGYSRMPNTETLLTVVAITLFIYATGWTLKYIFSGSTNSLLVTALRKLIEE